MSQPRVSSGAWEEIAFIAAVTGLNLIALGLVAKLFCLKARTNCVVLWAILFCALYVLFSEKKWRLQLIIFIAQTELSFRFETHWWLLQKLLMFCTRWPTTYMAFSFEVSICVSSTQNRCRSSETSNTFIVILFAVSFRKTNLAALSFFFWLCPVSSEAARKLSLPVPD